MLEINKKHLIEGLQRAQSKLNLAIAEAQIKEEDDLDVPVQTASQALDLLESLLLDF